jgi:hypothetical protein
LEGDYKGAKEISNRAKAIRAEMGYVVIEPNDISLQNAEAYWEFAKRVHDKQLESAAKELRPGLFSSCFGGSCSAVEPPPVVTIRNPLVEESQLPKSALYTPVGGRSRKRKLRKSRNKRRTRKY